MNFRGALGKALGYAGGGPRIGIFLVTLIGAAGYLVQLGLRYPVENWLVWRLLPLWLWTLGLNLALVLSGGALFRLLLPEARVGLVERLLHGLMFGLALFAFAIFGFGALGLLGPWFAVGLIATLSLLGAREGLSLWREARDDPAPPGPKGLLGKAFRVVVVGFTFWMLGFLYLESLTPNSFNFDANWYHVPTAQDYARLGKIVPFYGDNHRAYPHLASLLHTFALLVPGLEPLPLRWMLMLHLEFAMVVWRMLGVVALGQFLLGNRKVRGLSAVFFLFPAVFIYDQNIGGSADHVLGASAVPIFLALARMLPRFDSRWGLVTGVAAGVHILTKYQAVYLVFVVGAMVALRFVYFGVVGLLRRFRPRADLESPITPAKLWGAPLVIVGGALLVSSPHFIKNAVFYQNPVYPFMGKAFPSTFDDWEAPSSSRATSQATAKKRTKKKREPRSVDGPFHDDDEPTVETGARKPYDFRFRARSSSFDPQGDSRLEKFVWANKTFLDWAFVPGNRGLTEHRSYMGALFTLLLPVLLFLKRAGRIWLALFASYLAFMAWGLTNANDRYLLSFLTIPIGVAAALLVRAWEQGGLARVGTSALVGVQLIWGFDAPLFYGSQRLTDAIALIRSGYTGASDDKRFHYKMPERQLTEALPEDAVVLGRYYKDLIGIDRMMLNTHAPLQTYVDFTKLTSVRDFWQICRDRGITHLLYPEGQRQPVRAQEAVLFDALVEVSPGRRKMHGNVIVEVGDEPPPDQGPLLVYVSGIREYEDGLYPVQVLSLDYRSPTRGKSPRPLLSVKEGTTAELLEKASALYVKGLGGDESELALERFKKVESFGSVQVWLRR